MHMSMSCYTYVWFWDNSFSTSQLLPCTTPHLHQDLENPNRKWNDWETTFYVLFWGSFVLVGLGEAFRPDHGPESWARDEVAVRDARRAQDDEVTGKRDVVVRMLVSHKSRPLLRRSSMAQATV